MDKIISNRDQEKHDLAERFLEIYNGRKHRYGAPNIHDLLSEEVYQVSLILVQRLMKNADIRSIIVKKFRPEPSKEKVVERENILQRDFSTEMINEEWVGDIMYIYRLKHG